MYTLIVFLSLTMLRHRPSNCTIILPVLEGCGPVGVAMLTAVVGVLGVAVLAAVVGVVGVAVLMARLLWGWCHCLFTAHHRPISNLIMIIANIK